MYTSTNLSVCEGHCRHCPLPFPLTAERHLRHMFRGIARSDDSDLPSSRGKGTGWGTAPQVPAQVIDALPDYLIGLALPRRFL